MINILTFSTLFPNLAQPVHGIFVENRLRHLVASGNVTARVVAPVPWFPFQGERFGSYAAYAKVPAVEERHGLTIHHPRYPVIPKFGASLAPALMYMFMKPFIAELIRQGNDFDLIDSHYFYPDGVAAAWLGRTFGKPVTITARGTDINLMPQYALPRAQIKWAARQADGMVTVCQALKDELVALDVDADKVRVLRNGVDLDMFRPGDRQADREKLGLTGRTLLSVGLLIERKGHDLIIGALPRLPDITLLIAGDGPERGALERQAQTLGVQDRVRFLGRIGHDELRNVYGAVDALVLASSREGCQCAAGIDGLRYPGRCQQRMGNPGNCRRTCRRCVDGCPRVGCIGRRGRNPVCQSPRPCGNPHLCRTVRLGFNNTGPAGPVREHSAAQVTPPS